MRSWPSSSSMRRDCEKSFESSFRAKGRSEVWFNEAVGHSRFVVFTAIKGLKMFQPHEHFTSVCRRTSRFFERGNDPALTRDGTVVVSELCLLLSSQFDDSITQETGVKAKRTIWVDVTSLLRN